MIFIKVLCNLGKPKPFPLVSDDGSKWIKLNDHDMYRGLKLNLVSRKFPLVSVYDLKLYPVSTLVHPLTFMPFLWVNYSVLSDLTKKGGLIHLMSKEKLLKIFRKLKNYFKKWQSLGSSKQYIKKWVVS